MDGWLFSGIRKAGVIMTINAWYDPKAKTYNVMYDGRRYTRSSYTGAKELIDGLLMNMTAVALYA